MDEEPQVQETPPWLGAMIDQRLAAMADAAGALWPIMVKSADLIFIPLREFEGVSLEEADMTCDKCGVWQSEGLFTGTTGRVHMGKNFLFSFGICTECKEQYT